MTTSPVFSIITPVLNGEAFIGDAIRSVAEAATLGADVEHIIVDGGSSDRTLEIVDDAISTSGSPVTHVLTGPDSGQSQAINRGIAVAQGRYVGWLNADDYYIPAGLAKLSKHASESDSDIIVGRCRFVDHSGHAVFVPSPPDPVTPGSLLRLLSGWFAGHSIIQPEAFVNRESLLAAGGVDESLYYTMDYHLWLKLAVGGAAFDLTGIDVARQLVHPGQKTAENAAVVAEMLTYAFEMLDRVASSSERDIAERELDRVASRLRVLGRVCIGLKCIMSTTGAKLVSVEDRARLTEPQIQSIRGALAPSGRVLIAGIQPDDVRRVVSGLKCNVPPVIAGRVPELPSSFDVVVASGHAAAKMSGQIAITDLLRPGGIAFLAGVVRGGALQTRALGLRKALCDSVTLDSKVLLDTQDGVRLAEYMNRLARTVRGIRVPDSARIASTGEYTFSLGDHAVHVKDGSIHVEPCANGYRTGLLCRLY